MKKYNICFLAFSILMSAIMAAQSFPRLEVLKIEIVRVFNDLNLAPKMGKDNVISFTYEGEVYTFEYNEESSSLYYASISKYQEYTNEISMQEIMNFNTGFNYRTVKVIADENGFVVRSEFFFDNKETLKNICPQLLNSVSRTLKSLRRSSANFKRDSTLNILSFNPVAVFTDSTENVISALVSIDACYEGEYVLGVRVYRNNCLLRMDESINDYSRLDTLKLGQNNTLVKLPTLRCDTLSTSDRLRYELWYNRKCIVSEIVTNKTIE